jgi:hypothetical protein
LSLLNGLPTDILVSFLAAKKKPDFDPNSVTPGVIGFLVTIIFIGLVILLITDMVRRVRRTQYRAEVNQRLDAEAAELADEERGSEDDTPGASDDRGPA